MTLDRRQLRGITALFAVGLLLQGALTLLARLVPAVDRAAPAILRLTRMLPPHSWLHIVTGLMALWVLVQGPADGPRRFLLGFAVFYAALGIVGPVGGGRLGLGLQPFDHAIHLVIGGAALTAAWLGRGTR